MQSACQAWRARHQASYKGSRLAQRAAYGTKSINTREQAIYINKKGGGGRTCLPLSLLRSVAPRRIRGLLVFFSLQAGPAGLARALVGSSIQVVGHYRSYIIAYNIRGADVEW
jgi:hypothetical protein